MITAPRRARPAPPACLRKVWFSHPRDSPEGETVEGILDFLHSQRLLTRAGLRAYQMRHHDPRISLRPEHVRSHAHGFVEELVGIQAAELEDRWNNYSQRFDFSKPTRTNAFQRLLLGYSRDRTVDGLLLWLDRFPGLEGELERCTRLAGPHRSRVELVLEARRRGTLPPGWSADPSTSLSVLPYLGGTLEPRARLEQAAALSRLLPPDEAVLINLARSCNLGAAHARLALSLASQDAGHLARAVNRLFDAPGQQRLAACAMRTVGDARSLELLQSWRLGPAETRVRFGPRPGQVLARAVVMEARSCILKRAEVAQRSRIPAPTDGIQKNSTCFTGVAGEDARVTPGGEGAMPATAGHRP